MALVVRSIRSADKSSMTVYINLDTDKGDFEHTFEIRRDRGGNWVAILERFGKRDDIRAMWTSPGGPGNPELATCHMLGEMLRACRLVERREEDAKKFKDKR